MSSIKKVKKLLNKYPPVIEVRYPEEMDSYFQDFYWEVEEHIKKLNLGYRFMIIPFKTKSLNIVPPSLSEEQKENFMKEWIKATQKLPVQFMDKLPETKYYQIPAVRIHTAVKVNFNSLEKELQLLYNKYLNHDEEPISR